mmetsp:Transcript_12123/g.15811  ORF Transcript_12123/g.15811 Transcript_12123/m.15811 type:complete len:83 (+) Transcript_12123:226-474(+)
MVVVAWWIAASTNSSPPPLPLLAETMSVAVDKSTIPPNPQVVGTMTAIRIGMIFRIIIIIVFRFNIMHCISIYVYVSERLNI